MRNDVIRLQGHRGRPELSRRPYVPVRASAGPQASIITFFPGRLRHAPIKTGATKLVAWLELENTELRRQVVELALQIQALKDAWQ
jgi:hypothetical protein